MPGSQSIACNIDSATLVLAITFTVVDRFAFDMCRDTELSCDKQTGKRWLLVDGKRDEMPHSDT
jgi:hypothetical protein